MGALNTISWNKPEAALKLMADMDLSDNERKNLISNAVSRTRDDAEKAEALIALLGSEQDREFVRNTIARNAEGSKPDKTEQPAEWLEKAASFDSNSGSTYQFISQIESWDQEKIATLTSEFRTMPDDQKRKIAPLIAGSNSDLNPTLSGEAIRYLVTNAQPPQEGQTQNSNLNPTRLASSHVVQWANQDPVAASNWVQTLPAGEAKLWAQKYLAANWAQYDPDAASQWVNTLPADARTDVQTFMKSGDKN